MSNSSFERASRNLPENFAGLRAISTAVEDVFVSRELGCSCGSDHGTILATTDGELGYLDPVSFSCAKCKKSTKFFDSQRDGYDGRLNGGAAYRQGSNPAPVACPTCGDELATLQCGLAYNIDFEEDGQPELAADAENYFDSIAISARCTECSESYHIGDWELA